MAAICTRLPCRLKLRLGLWLVHHRLIDARLLDLGAPLGFRVGHPLHFRVYRGDGVPDFGHVVKEPFPFRADRFGGRRGGLGFAWELGLDLAFLADAGVSGRNRLSRLFGFRLGLGFRHGLRLCCLGSGRPGFCVGDYSVKLGVELRLGQRLGLWLRLRLWLRRYPLAPLVFVAPCTAAGAAVQSQCWWTITLHARFGRDAAHAEWFHRLRLAIKTGLPAASCEPGASCPPP